ncbi:hypothetical protein [Vreelandella boliviensis]|uniref:hypothetical protein n=1 Tax=Vreelandella boliviensis TaxID=223527 RepID=UPI001B8D09F5|nr:hypothetical protein [Halomonas boliviensis]MBS3670202.1 hypothetical protein [Halomonas boliviensis]
MSVRSLGQLTLDLVLKTGNFMGPIERAARNVKSRSQEIRTSLLTIGKAITAVSSVAAAGAVGLTAMTKVAAENARQIRNMADVSNASIEQFQRLAYGSKTVGVEGEKLADILKDVNDRIGDFVQTGGGPMADFFENIAPKVGVTADEFQRLSGPDALQLYYDSLEAANLSQKDMTFYLEAMASDVTALIPLLKDGGAGFADLADEADRVNAVLSTLEVERLEAVGREFQQLEQQLTTETARAVSQFDEMMKSSLEGISYGINRVAGGFNLFMDDLRSEENKRSLEGITAELGRLYDDKQRLEQSIDLFGTDAPRSQDAIAALAELEERYDILIARQKELTEASGDAIDVPPVLELDRVLNRQREEDEEKARLAAKRAEEAIEDQIAALELQAETLGMSSEAAKVFELTQEGATKKQLDAARAALETIRAYRASEEAGEKQSAAAKAASDERIREAKDLERAYEGLYDRLYPLQAEQRRFREEMELLDLAAQAGTIDNLAEAQERLRDSFRSSRSFEGEVGMFSMGGEDQEGYWDEWLQGAENAFSDFDKLSADVAEGFSGGIGDALEGILFDLEDVGDAGRAVFEGLARSTVNALGQMAGQWLAYQAVQLAVGKSTQAAGATALSANAQAGVFQAGINAFSSTAAIPIVGPAMAPAAMAAAIGATQPLAASVSAAALAGMAHDGIDSIPETGTWLLEKGERVTTADTSAKLDATLARVESQMNRPGDSGGSGSGGGAPIINVDARGSTDPAATERAVQRAVREALNGVGQDFATNGRLRRQLGI